MDVTYEGWAPDPFDAHELRYFVDGLPTKLVMTDRWKSSTTCPRVRPGRRICKPCDWPRRQLSNRWSRPSLMTWPFLKSP